MALEFLQQGVWTIPKQGVWGTKARNLYENTETIQNNSCKVPRSLVLPGDQFLQRGDIYYMMDLVTEHFSDVKQVAIRSSAPDEDLDTRTPGLYCSYTTDPNFRPEGIDALGCVLASYDNPLAKKRRERLGLPEIGMSLLVQELLPATYSGSFSDIGDLAILTFTNPSHALEAMSKPYLQKYNVDEVGKIVSDVSSDHQDIAVALRSLTRALPDLHDDGWELEFVSNQDGLYIVQTTPIRREVPFEVKPKNNIFSSIDVVGTGMFRTNGILYVPVYSSCSADLVVFDEENEHYCLVTGMEALMTAATKTGDYILNELEHADVVLCTRHRWEGNNPFSAHVEQFVRQGDRCAMLGLFHQTFLDTLGSDNLNRDYWNGGRSAYYDVNLVVQADERQQQSNIEVVK